MVSKISKIVAGLSIAGVIGIIAIVIISAILFPSSKIKPLIEKELSKSVGAKVEIERISFNIFADTILQEVKVSFNSKNYLNANAVKIKYSLTDALQHRFIPSEIKIIKPKIIISGSDKDKFTPKLNIKGLNKVSIVDGSLIIDSKFFGKKKINRLNLLIVSKGLKPTEVTISGLVGRKKERFVFAGKVTPDNKGWGLQNGSLNLKGEDISIAGAFAKEGKSYVGDFSVSAENADLLSFVSSFLPEKGFENKTTKAFVSLFKTIPPSLRCSVNFSLPKSKISKLKFDQLDGKLSFINRKIYIKFNKAISCNGELNAKKIMFDTANFSYTVDKLEMKRGDARLFLSGIIESFFPQFINLKNNVEGVLEYSIDITGSGLQNPEAAQDLKVGGIVLISKGKMSKSSTLASFGRQYHFTGLNKQIILDGFRLQGRIDGMILTVSKAFFQTPSFTGAFIGGLDFNSWGYVSGSKLFLNLQPNLIGTTFNLTDGTKVVKVSLGLSGPLDIPKIELLSDLNETIPVNPQPAVLKKELPSLLDKPAYDENGKRDTLPKEVDGKSKIKEIKNF